MEKRYPKRLIEVDLPISRISANSRREKSIRKGHISSLHIWWARRPLAACRAVLCASLWPDPVDLRENFVEYKDFVQDNEIGVVHPEFFLCEAERQMYRWAKKNLSLASQSSYRRLLQIQKGSDFLEDPVNLRNVLLDFIADFSIWENSQMHEYLEVSRALTSAAQETLCGIKGTNPVVLDPFAGGGSIPLESLRLGADTFAIDLNPVAVLLNKAILEYLPKYGRTLVKEINKWGEWIQREAEEELGALFPSLKDGSNPKAYLWARTLNCEGPSCGRTIPAIRTTTLLTRSKNKQFLRITENPNHLKIKIEIVQDQPSQATISSGKLTCPVCGYTTSAKNTMSQMTKRRGGTEDASLICVISEDTNGARQFNLPSTDDIEAAQVYSSEILSELSNQGYNAPIDSINPLRPSPNARGLSAVTRYGMSNFSDLYTIRQKATLLAFQRIINEASEKMDPSIRIPVTTFLALSLGRLLDRDTSLCRWIPQTGAVGFTFGRQALSMIWDFVEINPLTHSGGWTGAYKTVSSVIEKQICIEKSGEVFNSSATSLVLPDDSITMLATDPPYYDSIPYADLSDFFYVWLKQLLRPIHSSLFSSELTPKDDEAIWNPSRYLPCGKNKDKEFYESMMTRAFEEGRRVTAPSGLGIVVFAHKSTDGWEAMLQSLLSAGWIITASWPIDTERSARTNAIGTASLASSVHLVCRPREMPDGTIREDEIGEWRDVISELPIRIQEWMPRLAAEGIVGADAIFACLGPALEIFSRYSRVEKASGESVALREYLEQVWATVSQEALSVIFENADTQISEPEARLTAMWLWTLGVGNKAGTGNDLGNNQNDAREEVEPIQSSGFNLEYDTARKIAQGLGVHLEKVTSVVEIKGETARLLPVVERTQYLFGKDNELERGRHRRTTNAKQLSLFSELEEAEDVDTGELNSKGPIPGSTILDCVHQAMILFGIGRGEALRRFLVEDGVGKDDGFWKFAQALSALYPPEIEEKRWVDGVLARKRGLGF